MHVDKNRKQSNCATRDDEAPLFTAPALIGKDVQELSLADYKGRWVVLFFYPSDFTFV